MEEEKNCMKADVIRTCLRMTKQENWRKFKSATRNPCGHMAAEDLFHVAEHSGHFKSIPELK